APVAGMMTVLAPAGCDIAESASVEIDPTGVPARRWRPLGDFAVLPRGSGQHWWQVTCDGVVRYQQPWASYPQVKLDPSADRVPRRGTAEPGALQRVTSGWNASGSGITARPTASWGGVPAGR